MAAVLLLLGLWLAWTPDKPADELLARVFFDAERDEAAGEVDAGAVIKQAQWHETNPPCKQFAS